MYNSLLLETGGGIISKSQVSPQQGDACVMIGIGGTGVAALRKVKKAVYQHLEPDEHTQDSVPKYEKIRFLAIDTDPKDLERSSDLSPDEKLCIWNEKLFYEELCILMANPDCFRQNTSLRWMSEELFTARSFTTGPVRQVGRYYLIKKSSELKTKISELIVGAKKAAGKSEINIHIFAGISGVTGSGCFIDVCYIVREILKNMSGRVFGYFFLPDIQFHRRGLMGQEALEKWNMQNGYAALRELDYLMSLPDSNEYFEQDYGEFVVKSREKPVDDCYLISGTNSDGVIIPNAYDHALNVVAEYILFYLSRGYNNLGYSVGYHILGASSAEFPLTHIATYLAGKTYEKMKVSLERHSSNEVLLKFADNMGYTFEGIRRLVVEGVNFKPMYNMNSIGNPGALNEEMINCEMAISAIIQPFEICRNTAIEVMTTNVRAQTQELQTYNHEKTEKIENPTFATKLFNELVTCCKSVNSGPTMAAELLHSDSIKDLTSIMDGIIGQANERQKYYEVNLDLRKEDICSAAHSYNKAHIGKKKKLQNYLYARDNYLNCYLEIEVCKRIVLMCSGFKLIISNLYANYFSPMRSMIHELDETFRANIQWLNTPENMVSQDYCWRIFELSDIQETLNETVLRSQQMDVEHSAFVNFLISHFNDWKGQNQYRTCRCINEYMAAHFDEVLPQNVDQFLTSVAGGVAPAKLADIILEKVRERSAPLFWSSSCFSINNKNTKEFNAVLIPSDSIIFKVAAENIEDTPGIIIPIIDDKIKSINIVSGIPLFGYRGIYEWKNVYENSTAKGIHLHERDVNWKETLPSPIPYSYDKSATKNGKEKEELYYLSVKKKIICPIAPDRFSEYVVRLIPNVNNMLSEYKKEKYFQNGNLLEEDLCKAIRELKEKRESLIPATVPSEQKLILKNDGCTSYITENDYFERVRIDYFVRFAGIQKAAKESLDNLQKVDDKIAEMQSWIIEQFYWQ